MKKILITGGCGFLGSNLASHSIKNGFEVSIIDNLSRKGSDQNLKWLRSIGSFQFHEVDVKEGLKVEEIIKNFTPDIVFHVAGQVAMTTSLVNPKADFETNALGTLNVLEGIRKHSNSSILIYSSTNKVYGDLEDFKYEEAEYRYICHEYPSGFDESLSLNFRTPYGCSKGSADQYVLDYSKNYELKTVVFRHSSIYGGRQFSSYDQGWIGWFVKQVVDGSEFTISGNGKQVRDVLHSKDLINCYFKAIENIEKTSGEVFNIGGGIENSLSILELVKILEEKLGKKANYKNIEVRKSDQKIFVADIKKMYRLTGWKPEVSMTDGINMMIDWIKQSGDLA